MSAPTERLEQPVERCMTTSLVTVEPGATMVEAAQVLAANGIGLLVVAEDGVVVGVVSERDVVRVLADGVQPGAVAVEDRGRGEVVTIAASDSLADALERMLASDVRHLLAVDDDGQPAGVLSMRDVMIELAVR